MTKKSGTFEDIRYLWKNNGGFVELQSNMPIEPRQSITASEFIIALATATPEITESLEIKLGTTSANVSATIFETLAQNQANLILGEVLTGGVILLSGEGCNALFTTHEGILTTTVGDDADGQTYSEGGQQLDGAVHLFDNRKPGVYNDSSSPFTINSIPKELIGDLKFNVVFSFWTQNGDNSTADDTLKLSLGDNGALVLTSSAYPLSSIKIGTVSLHKDSVSLELISSLYDYFVAVILDTGSSSGIKFGGIGINTIVMTVDGATIEWGNPRNGNVDELNGKLASRIQSIYESAVARRIIGLEALRVAQTGNLPLAKELTTQAGVNGRTIAEARQLVAGLHAKSQQLSSNYQTIEHGEVYKILTTGRLVNKDGNDFPTGTKIILVNPASPKTVGLIVDMNGSALAQAGAINPTPVELDEASILQDFDKWNNTHPNDVRDANKEMIKLKSSGVFRVHNPQTHIETLVGANLAPLTQLRINDEPIDIVFCAQAQNTKVQVLKNKSNQTLNFDTFRVQTDSQAVETYSPTPPHPKAWVVVRSDSDGTLLDPSSLQPMMDLRISDVSASENNHEYLLIKSDNKVFEPFTMMPASPPIFLTEAIGPTGTVRKFFLTSTQELVKLTTQSHTARIIQIHGGAPHDNLSVMVTTNPQLHP